jgi:hypothetical protein
LWVYILMFYLFIYLFIFLQWAISLVYHQKHYEISPPQVKITFFTLPCKIIYIYFFIYIFYTIALNYINKFFFTGTLTFTWSVSPKTIYTQHWFWPIFMWRTAFGLGAFTKIWDLPLAPALGGSIIMLNSHPRTLPYIEINLSHWINIAVMQ